MSDTIEMPVCDNCGQTARSSLHKCPDAFRKDARDLATPAVQLVKNVVEKYTRAILEEVHDQIVTRDAELSRLQARIGELERDAGRYRWLRDLKCNSLHLERDGHACNYVSAKEWIEGHSPEWYEDDSAEEIQRMKDSNTIWCLQIYPSTPIGFNVWNAATLDTAIDQAMRKV